MNPAPLESVKPSAKQSPSPPKWRGVQRVLKRATDLLGSIIVITLLSPLFLLLAGLIRLMDGPPVTYRRRVVGPRGEFDAFKFRTMVPDADLVLQNNPRLQEQFLENFKLKSDPRVTRLGSVLRKYSLDELPQLFNVARGEMSLVGPRMITRPELEKYGEYRELLLTVKPGLTGYWQVHGRQDVPYAERVRMDIEYIRGWRLGTDLEILLLTPLRIVRGKGAY